MVRSKELHISRRHQTTVDIFARWVERVAE
jgi:hypothetical protein